MKRIINFLLNGQKVEMAVEPNMPLVDLLREELGLTGTKKGCGHGDCGACAVLLNGKAVNSCIILAVEADGGEVETIEGLEDENGLHPIQNAFVEKGAIQCGFCTSGMIISLKSLLDQNPKPDEHEIRRSISGNLCRCTGYQKIVEAVKSVVEERHL